MFDSRTLNFAQEVLELTGGRGVDVALNSLADDFVGATFSILAAGGRFIEIGKRGIWTAEQVRALGKGHLLLCGRSGSRLGRRAGTYLGTADAHCPGGGAGGMDTAAVPEFSLCGRD